MRKNAGTFFFTVNLQNRDSDLLLTHRHVLKQSLLIVQKQYTFTINSMVLLITCTLYGRYQDTNYSLRWQLIKTIFSKSVRKQQLHPQQIWQHRFWERLIRDEEDYIKHMSQPGKTLDPGQWSDINHFPKTDIKKEGLDFGGSEVGSEVGFKERSGKPTTSAKRWQCHQTTQNQIALTIKTRGDSAHKYRYIVRRALCAPGALSAYASL